MIRTCTKCHRDFDDIEDQYVTVGGVIQCMMCGRGMRAVSHPKPPEDSPRPEPKGSIYQQVARASTNLRRQLGMADWTRPRVRTPPEDMKGRGE